MNTSDYIIRFDEEADRKAIAETYPPSSMIFNGEHPVVIFAAAQMGLLFLSNLRKAGVEVRAFGDNDSSKWGTNIEGVEVLDSDSLIRDYRDSPIIVSSLLAESEIFHDLKNRGFKSVFPLSYLHYLNPDVFQAPYLDGSFESCYDLTIRKRIEAAAEIWSDRESKIFTITS